jgi:hypothetical protein
LTEEYLALPDSLDIPSLGNSIAYKKNVCWDKTAVDGVVHFLVWCHKDYCSLCKIYPQLDRKDLKRKITNKQKVVYVFKLKLLDLKLPNLLVTCRLMSCFGAMLKVPA